MKRVLNWKLLAPLTLVALALMAVVSSWAGVTGGGGGVIAAPAAQSGYGYIPNSIAVSGYGEASGAPDIAYVQLGVTVANSDVGQAVSQANELMNSVRDALKAAGVADADMQTAGFNVWPEDRYDQSGQPTGERVYHVDNTLSIKVREMAQTSAIIETGLDAGATSVYGLSFGIDDSTGLESQARQAAIADARARAEHIAQILGVKVGDAIAVTEGYNGGGIPYYPMMTGADAMGAAGNAGAPPISPGSLSVGVNLQIVFSIEK